MFKDIEFKSRKYEYRDEIQLIGESLANGTGTYDEIREYIFENSVSRWYDNLTEEKQKQTAEKRIKKALEYLVKNNLVAKSGTGFQLTVKGRKQLLSQDSTAIYDYHALSFFMKETWVPLLTTLIYGILGFVAIYFSLDLGSGSLFGLGIYTWAFIVGTWVMLLATKVGKEVVFNRILNWGLAVVGLIVMMINITLLFQEIPSYQPSESNIALLLVFFLIFFTMAIGMYFYQMLVGLQHDSLLILTVANDNAMLLGASGMFLLTILAGYLDIIIIDPLIGMFIGFFIIITNFETVKDGYMRLITVLLKDAPQTMEDILHAVQRMSLRFGSTDFLQESDKLTHEAKKRLNLLQFQRAVEHMVTLGLIKQDNNHFILTAKGEIKAEESARGLSKVFKVLKRLTDPVISPLLSLLVHLILGSIKLAGFLVIGSVSLLADGIDSAIDGVSAIVVGIAMKIDKEKEATYLLLGLMLFTALSILWQGVERIISPVPLQEELLAIIIAVLSIIVCSGLYYYQRYSGYKNRSLAILAQSEDSKNHVLNAALVMVAIAAGNFQLYFIDGIVGCFIGLVILQGAYELYEDLKAESQGETINYDKYKLGIWKRYEKVQEQVLDTYVLKRVFDGHDTVAKLIDIFETDFAPFLVEYSDETHLLHFSQDKKQLEQSVQKLLDQDLLARETDESKTLSLTREGLKQLKTSHGVRKSLKKSSYGVQQKR